MIHFQVNSTRVVVVRCCSPDHWDRVPVARPTPSAGARRSLSPRVAELKGAVPRSAAECSRLDLPVSHRVGKQADPSVEKLLCFGSGGAEVVHGHTADAVLMQVHHLTGQQKGVAVSNRIAPP